MKEIKRNKIIPYNPKLKELARELRKNSTPAEIVFWKMVKGKSLGVEFHRQVPMLNYIVDFYCPAVNLVIECDSGQHYTEDGLEAHRNRELTLNELGLLTLRFSNHQILTEIDAVVKKIS